MAGLLASAVLALPTAPTGAATTGLPDVDTGPLPGPDALYLPPPVAPQLQNVGVWQAEPILVSGTSAYRDGEWLYQDFLFDDHGATGTPDRGDPYGISTNLYSPSAGTFTYPTADGYAHNAADLVELRIKPLDDATAVRITLNTLLDPTLTGATIALGDSTADADWPHGAGVTSPAEVFLTWHGDVAELVSAADGAPITPTPTAQVDHERRQIDLRVPHAAWDPADATVRVTIGVGLWDVEGDAYLAPQPGSATETTPGGGSPTGTALVNVGPRYDEPTPLLAGVTMADTAVGARALAPWWRERQQSLQLTQGDVSPFFAEVDFAKLAAGTDDDSGLPTSGAMNRIMASRYVFGQGLEPENICFGISSGIDVGVECVGRYVGQLQPYAMYVPDKPAPADGYGLTLLMHSLSANYNQYTTTRNQSQLGDRGSGSIVVTPEARGPDGFYKGIPEANVFEVWADVARHYPINPDWVAPSGYSMGGFGTYRLMARWPDLFSRGFSVVGEPGTVDDQLVSMRNHQLMAWNAAGDELVNINTAETAHADLVAAEVDHQYWLFPTADHLTLAGNDEYQPGADFLGEVEVDRNPATVTYVVDPREDSLDVVADHAYWLSGLTVRDPDASPTGTIEVHSGGFGVAPSTAIDHSPGAGVMTGGQNQAMSYVTRGVERQGGETTPIEDKLWVTATNVSKVTIDPVRAKVTCDVELVVESDGPIEVDLTGCPTAGGVVTDPAPTPPVLPSTGGGLVLVAAGMLAVATVAGRRRGR